jgi:transposase-like protein
MFQANHALNERQIESRLRKIVFPKGRLKCPHCGSFIVKRIKSEQRYHCRRCRKKFSLLSGTWMKDIKIPLAKFILLFEFWAEGYGVKDSSGLSKTSVPTVRRYFRLFRKNIVKTIDFRPQNNVQVDEAYFGRLKKQSNIYHGWRTFRVQEKVCVAGIGCPSTGTLATRVIEGAKGGPIRKFIYEKVPTDIHIYSDGSRIYTRLREDYRHTSQTHDLGFHNAYYIESCWSWMKRRLFKQYHHFHRKNAEEYVSELTWRFNTRKMPKNVFNYIKNSL